MDSCAAWSRSRYSLSLLSIPRWVAVAISLALDLLSGFSCGIGVDAVEDVVVGSICGISAEEDAIC
jgi:hypothetical protein